jgi:hypothetical protein
VDDSKKYLEQQLQAFREYGEAKIRAVQSRLNQQLRNIADAKIASIRATMEEGMKKAAEQYEKGMKEADKCGNIPELADNARRSAKRQLETSIQGYRDIADTAIRAIEALVK